MKICILTPRFPYPQWGGDTLRINEIAKYLKQQGHQLILVSLSDAPNPPVEAAAPLYNKVYFVPRNRWSSYFYSLLYFLTGRPMQCGYYRSSAYMSLLRQVVAEEKPDLYTSHLLRMVPYLEQLGVQSQSIVEMTDALSKTYALSSSAKNTGLLKYIYALEQRLIRRYELHVVRSFPKVVLVSKEDADYLKQQDTSLPDHLSVYTNGVNIPEQTADSYDPNKIVFVGNMRSMQNQDAAMYFAREVFPLILSENPNAVFHIVGSLPPASILALASDHIRVTGFIEDLEAYISDACVAVAPVRVAAGIQNKVLLAMGCSVPVIMSGLISHAIPQLEHRSNCIIEDLTANIAKECLTLMNNPTLRNQIGENGHQMVRRHYSWQEKLQGYENIKQLLRQA